ncbi:MAG: hypothetical protein NC338_00125 [Firmicutes bacterium]|nr:hypothetical protein [Bacillota bacterium]MCM1401443.1 hypothetical protein [Bacteroides sp.]MCM1476801.1 hypothetical protein [Bacteroides sp.]
MKHSLLQFSTLVCTVAALVSGTANIDASTPRGVRVAPTQPSVKVTAPRAIGSAASDYEAITDWQSIGTGRYTDGFVAWAAQDTGYEMAPWQVEVEESASHSGLYRVVNPYLGCSYAADYDEVDMSKDYYMIVDATDAQNVYIPEFETGVKPYYANDEMVWGRSYSPGVLEDLVITFPSNGLNCMTQSQGWLTSNNDANFTLYLPGAKDYSASISGSESCLNGETADIIITTGADIATVTYTMGLENQTPDVINSATPDNGNLELQFPADKHGKWLFRANCFDSEGNLKATLSMAFFRNLDNDANWTSLGQATMTEGFALAFFGDYYGPNTYEVEIQENVNTPGFYRIVNPALNNPNEYIAEYDIHYCSLDHYLYIHAENPKQVYVEEWPVGLDMYYGNMIIKQLNGYGTLANNVIDIPGDAIGMWSSDFNGGSPVTMRTDFVVTMPEGYSDIESIEISNANEPEEYFNLQGIKVEHPEVGGLYIVRKGTKTSKVFVTE